jgi:transcriptional regulator with XRE-family HTH domain
MLSGTEHLVKPHLIRTADYGKGHYGRMDIATVIRDARRKAKLSQRALADKIGVAPSAVGQWETEATKPSIANRVDLASLLSIPFAQLLPEASGGAGEVSSRNPETIILVRQFEALPPRVRESILMQVVATAEALRQTDAEEPPAKK